MTVDHARMADFLQTLLIAITLGSLYALIALGYTMVYGVLKLINFAHSDVVVLGAWTSLTAAAFFLPLLGQSTAEPPIWAAGAVLILSMTVCGIVGFLIERLAYKPIRSAPRLNALITAIGVSLLLQSVGQLRYTVIDNETVVAAGPMLERGADAKTVKLGNEVTLEPGYTYAVKAIKRDAKPDAKGNLSGSTRPVVAAAGRYAAGADLALAGPIPRSDTREANFELHRIASRPKLMLPFGAMPEKMPPLVSDHPLMTIHFVSETANGRVEKPLRIGRVDLMILGTAIGLMIALQLLVYRTRIGTAMRAVSFNMETAALMGIPVDRVVSFTFVTGTVLAAAAGFLYALYFHQLQQPANSAWVLLGLKAFVAAVVGGIGNIRGAAVGGFLIAFIEYFIPFAGNQIGWDNATAYQDVFVFSLLILVLLVRPAGLFGSTAREKV